MGRTIELEGYGSVRRRGLFGVNADLVPVDGRVLSAGGHGARRSPYRAVDQAGSTVGEFRRRRLLSRNGEIHWRGLPHDLTRKSAFGNTYTLSRYGRQQLSVSASSWGRRPPSLTVDDRSLEPGLVLFVVWLAQRFASEDAAAS